MLTRGKVILFYPAYDGPPLGAPLCLLALASTLRQADFDVVLIDAAIESDYRTRIECEAVDALCIGISVLTGPMIKGAIEIATAIKSVHPWLPIIFGGWHPTLLPDETLSEPFVDVVVRGQGEVTIVEVARSPAGEKIFGWDCRSFMEEPRPPFAQRRSPRGTAGRATRSSL